MIGVVQNRNMKINIYMEKTYQTEKWRAKRQTFSNELDSYISIYKFDNEVTTFPVSIEDIDSLIEFLKEIKPIVENEI